MEKEFVPYQEALELKELGLVEDCFGRFYTKPKSIMFGIDEHRRFYRIKNTNKKLYTRGVHYASRDSNVIIAPTFSQAFRLFREKHNIACSIQLFSDGWDYIIYSTTMKETDFGDGKFKTHEESELACLRRLIEIVKSWK